MRCVATVVAVMAVLTFAVRSSFHDGAHDVNDDDDDEDLRSKRIIGGHKYNRGKWPSLISLSGTRTTQSIFGVGVSFQYLACGGSLIGKRWVLTAGHCFPNETKDHPEWWEVTLGETNTKASRPFCCFIGWLLGINNWKVWKVPVVKIIIHPGYKQKTNWQNDLAVLKLKTAVPDSMAHTPRIRKMALPYQGDNSFPKAGQTCYMKGWGCDKKGGAKLEIAEEVMLPIVSNAACTKFFYGGFQWTTRFCAGHNQSTQGLCQGDSGGPLVCRRNNRWVQVGVASFSTNDNPGQVPGVFTRVSAYVDWIKQTMSAN